MDRRECQADVGDRNGNGWLFMSKFFLKQVLFMALFAVFFVVFLVGRHAGNDGRAHHAINSMIALFSTCFLLLVRSNAAIFDCSEHKPGTWTLDEFPDFNCYEGAWFGVAAYAAISLLTYVIVIPGMLLRKLSAAKKDGTLVDPETKAKYGWLFLRYKYHVCVYYEFVMMAKKPW